MKSRWDDVARAIGAQAGCVLSVHQVHGAAAVVHRAGQPRADGVEADIIVTDDPATAAAVRTADCVPLLLADSKTGAVAAAHAGWRGTALRVAATAVNELAYEFGSRPADLFAAIGPSIGPCCYQVGDVRSRFADAGSSDAELARWFFARPAQLSMNPPMPGLPGDAQEGRWFLDLWTATRDHLAGAGIPQEHIFAAELCTASHPDPFCSYRRDGPPAGRLAAAIRARAI